MGPVDLPPVWTAARGECGWTEAMEAGAPDHTGLTNGAEEAMAAEGQRGRAPLLTRPTGVPVALRFF